MSLIKKHRQNFDSCVTTTSCIEKATSYYSKFLLRKVKNFNQQKDRITIFTKQSQGKNSKMSIFVLLINRLREVGGGNSSNLTCNGETGPGAEYIAELSDTLSSCGDNINQACDSTFSGPDANLTYINECAARAF